VAWSLELRCRTLEAVELVEHACAGQGIRPGQLTLGTDNGSAFTSRAFRSALQALGVCHRRGGYRDPESQAFIESWFGKLKEREVWRCTRRSSRLEPPSACTSSATTTGPTRP